MTATLQNYNALPILHRMADVYKLEFESINPERYWEIGTTPDSWDDMLKLVGVNRNDRTSGGVMWLRYREGTERFMGEVAGRWKSTQQVYCQVGVNITGDWQDTQLTRDDYFQSVFAKSREIALRYQSWNDENGDPLATDTNLTNGGFRPSRTNTNGRILTFDYYMNVDHKFWYR